MMKRNNCLPHFLLLFLCFTVPVAANAESINIERASGRFRDSAYLVDVRIKYDLGDSVLEAMQHGIVLTFHVMLEIKQERDFVWDKTIKSETLEYQLQYQPLNNDYLVILVNSGEREQMQNLNEAISYMGTIKNYNFIDRDLLVADKTYNCFVKSELKINTLPLPLQPVAYVSPSWYLESQWYEWTVR